LCTILIDAPLPSNWENPPVIGDLIPEVGRLSPRFGEPLPLFGEHSPKFGRFCPVIGENSPAFGEPLPMFGEHSPKFGRTPPVSGETFPMFGEFSPEVGETLPEVIFPSEKLRERKKYPAILVSLLSAAMDLLLLAAERQVGYGAEHCNQYQNLWICPVMVIG